MEEGDKIIHITLTTNFSRALEKKKRKKRRHKFRYYATTCNASLLRLHKVNQQ